MNSRQSRNKSSKLAISSTSKFNQSVENLALPESILFYIAKNVSSPLVYQKLIKCSDYFYQKNPCLLLHCLKYCSSDGKWYTCEKFDKKSCKGRNGKFCRHLSPIYLDTIPKKIWVTNVLETGRLSREKASSLFVPEKFQSSVVMFKGLNQTFSIDELLLLGPFAKACDLWNITVTNADQSEASLAQIIECFPLVESFEFRLESDSSHGTSENVKALSKVLHSSGIKKLVFHNVCEEFDIEQFYQLFLKKNKTMDVVLWFNYNVSEAYEQKLGAMMDEILESKRDDFWPPIFYGVSYDGTRSLEYAHSAYRKNALKY